MLDKKTEEILQEMLAELKKNTEIIKEIRKIIAQ